MAATAPHVPAWKKLGLRLKFAKDTPEPVQFGTNGVLKPKKRKLSPEVVNGVSKTAHTPPAMRPAEHDGKEPTTRSAQTKSEDLVIIRMKLPLNLCA